MYISYDLYWMPSSRLFPTRIDTGPCHVKQRTDPTGGVCRSSEVFVLGSMANYLQALHVLYYMYVHIYIYIYMLYIYMYILYNTH